MNPMMWYWFEVCENVSILLILFLIFSFIGLVIYRIWGYVKWDDGDIEDEEYKKIKFKTNILFFLAVVLSFVCCFIPSQKTLIAMAITDRLTYENINEATQFVIDTIKKIKE